MIGRPDFTLPLGGDEWWKAAPLPAWFTPSSYQPTAERNVRLGKHPTGAPLGAAHETCGGCDHLIRVRPTPSPKTYLKCGLGSVSHCIASDIRKKWRACSQWKRRKGTA